MIGYILIAYVSLASRWKLIDRIRQGDVEISEFYCSVYGMDHRDCDSLQLCSVYLQPVRSNGEKEQQMLSQLLAESERHYERLVEEPFAYGQNLSGNVTLDAVVGRLYEACAGTNAFCLMLS